MLSRKQILDEFKKHPWPFTFVDDALTFAEHIAEMSRKEALEEAAKIFDSYPLAGIEISTRILALKDKQ